MSIRLIAKELYAARRREESLATELDEAKRVASADMAYTSRLEDELRRARAERRRMEEILAGHIDRTRTRT